MDPPEELIALRRRVIRRCVYALNSLALRHDRVPRDGAFDAAVANALATIIADWRDGQEFDSKGRVRSPLELLKMVTNSSSRRPQETQLMAQFKTLQDGVESAQQFRHGRADDEWDALGTHHVEALIALDTHPSLRVLNIVDGLNFADAAFELYRHESNKLLPSNPKDRSIAIEPTDCLECGRMTLIVDSFHWSGIGVGKGFCIACGFEQTEQVADDEFFRWWMEHND